MFSQSRFLLLLLLFYVSDCVQQEGRRFDASLLEQDSNYEIYHSYRNAASLYWNPQTLEYIIIRDGQVWLEGGPFFIHFNYTFYSSAPEQESLKMLPLQLIDQYQSNGTDTFFGPFLKLSLRWSSTLSPYYFIWETSFKIFQEQSIILFEQYFPIDLFGVELGNKRDTFKHVSSAFPRFKVSLNDSDNYLIDTLGHFTFLDTWDLNMRGVGLKNVFTGGLYSGNPLLLYNLQQLDQSIVLSSLNNFMSNFQTRSPSLQYHFACGLQGRVRQVEQSFSLATLLLISQPNEGINRIMNKWGKYMLQYYGKQHVKDEGNHQNDFFMSKLGYYTDTGSYYWYNTEPDLNYEETFIKLKQYHVAQQIPIQYYELDSYWYYKENNYTGEHGGILWYEPRPDVFPSGIEQLRMNTLQTPLIVHHKYYSYDNLYQIFYRFLNGSDYKVSLPLDQTFFNKILSQIKQWGVEIMIQDWLSSIYEDMPEASWDTYTAREYHLHLAGGAKQAGIKLLYCMPLIPDIMETLENSQVKYIRISNDYSTDINQWDIGRASIVTWALGIIPFKDTFWTMSMQPQSPYGKFIEPNVELNALIALMSLGGVAISDKIGNTNSTVVNRLCRSDGVLFRPRKPATSMDSTFFGVGGPDGELWHTYGSDLQQTYFVEYVMATNLTQSYEFAWNELLNTVDEDTPRRTISDVYIVFSLNNLTDYYWITSTNPFTFLIPSCPQNLTTYYSPFHLFVFVPAQKESKWILFGELAKQLPITQQRFSSVQFSSRPADSLQVDVIGIDGEEVLVTVGFSSQVLGRIDIITVQCSFRTMQPTTIMTMSCNVSNGCQCQ
ncbi:unnamed protein product [Didymodactylos carnosus]|uniref:Uncharacterized protein n=1 Tax=Didymodactylos carnosus TaxID=1234261 RepID=A0A814PVY5_9BILA|nr:unnamed protein product [Didymodactylos carnosus]CAF1111124.1 unnamed protein product [Didymodactylos carnosus]CAF3863794.1 unnamed protein product [Didymodactylos carnosus]CAF3875535.1 unnamed protein product [Didymodactylos carnosus]